MIGKVSLIKIGSFAFDAFLWLLLVTLLVARSTGDFDGPLLLLLMFLFFIFGMLEVELDVDEDEEVVVAAGSSSMMTSLSIESLSFFSTISMSESLCSIYMNACFHKFNLRINVQLRVKSESLMTNTIKKADRYDFYLATEKNYLSIKKF